MNIVYVKRKRKPYRRYFYGAGDNSYSVFGNGHEWRFTSPTLLDVENSTDNVWKMISSNYQSSTIFGIKNDGTLWVWGNNNGGQSGESRKGIIGDHKRVFDSELINMIDERCKQEIEYIDSFLY
jgi:alpha-tubulin suppressor-like RCC1 family protein